MAGGCVRAQWASGKLPWSWDDLAPNPLLSKWASGPSPPRAVPDNLEQAYSITQRQMQAVFADASMLQRK